MTYYFHSEYLQFIYSLNNIHIYHTLSFIRLIFNWYQHRKVGDVLSLINENVVVLIAKMNFLGTLTARLRVPSTDDIPNWSYS